MLVVGAVVGTPVGTVEVGSKVGGKVGGKVGRMVGSVVGGTVAGVLMAHTSVRIWVVKLSAAAWFSDMANSLPDASAFRSDVRRKLPMPTAHLFTSPWL